MNLFQIKLVPDIKSQFQEIKFFADKVHVHHWPLDTPKWNDSIKTRIDQDLNKNKEKKEIIIRGKTVLVGSFEFQLIKKVGLTIPLFKNQSTLVFEGIFDGFSAHVHITTSSNDYLEVFNKLAHWRSANFPDEA